MLAQVKTLSGFYSMTPASKLLIYQHLNLGTTFPNNIKRHSVHNHFKHLLCFLPGRNLTSNAMPSIGRKHTVQIILLPRLSLAHAYLHMHTWTFIFLFIGNCSWNFSSFFGLIQTYQKWIFHSHIVSRLSKMNTETLIVVEKKHAEKMLDDEVCSNISKWP